MICPPKLKTDRVTVGDITVHQRLQTLFMMKMMMMIIIIIIIQICNQRDRRLFRYNITNALLVGTQISIGKSKRENRYIWLLKIANQ